MSNTPTIPAEPTTAPPAEPTPPDDSGLWDMERGMRTIKVLRGVESQLTKENHWLRNSLQAMAAGRPLTVEQQAIIDAATPAADATAKAYEDGLLAVGAVLGVSADAVKTGPDAILTAARDARLSGPLARATAKAGVDHDLATALLSQSGALAAIDLTGDVGAQLAEAIGHVKIDHPAVRVQSGPATSMVPMPAGSSSSQRPVLTREALRFMSAPEIQAARKAGLIPGVSSDG